MADQVGCLAGGLVYGSVFFRGPHHKRAGVPLSFQLKPTKRGHKGVPREMGAFWVPWFVVSKR